MKIKSSLFLVLLTLTVSHNLEANAAPPPFILEKSIKIPRHEDATNFFFSYRTLYPVDQDQVLFVRRNIPGSRKTPDTLFKINFKTGKSKVLVEFGDIGFVYHFPKLNWHLVGISAAPDDDSFFGAIPSQILLIRNGRPGGFLRIPKNSMLEKVVVTGDTEFIYISKGKLFVYDLLENKVTKEVDFSGRYINPQHTHVRRENGGYALQFYSQTTYQIGVAFFDKNHNLVKEIYTQDFSKKEERLSISYRGDVGKKPIIVLGRTSTFSRYFNIKKMITLDSNYKAESEIDFKAEKTCKTSLNAHLMPKRKAFFLLCYSGISMYDLNGKQLWTFAQRNDVNLTFLPITAAAHKVGTQSLFVPGASTDNSAIDIDTGETQAYKKTKEEFAYYGPILSMGADSFVATRKAQYFYEEEKDTHFYYIEKLRIPKN